MFPIETDVPLHEDKLQKPSRRGVRGVPQKGYTDALRSLLVGQSVVLPVSHQAIGSTKRHAVRMTRFKFEHRRLEDGRVRFWRVD